jgi:hypothetical protein
MRSPAAALRRALEASGLPAGTDISALGVVETRGTYAGRPVRYFRVFDPKRAAAQAVDVFASYAYQDLNAHLELVLRAGFIEQDGTVVVFSPLPAWDPAVPPRARANRAAHQGDERFVFPDGDQARGQRLPPTVPQVEVPA